MTITHNDTTSQGTNAAGLAPQPAAGLMLHGEYAGSGYAEPRYLVIRLDGQAVHLTRMLYLVLEALRRHPTAAAAAADVSSALNRELTPDGLTFLAENRLRPLGLLVDPQRTAGPAPTKADPVLSVRLHTTLIPERRVQTAGWLLAPLFAWPVIVCVLIALSVTDVLLVTHADLSSATQSLIGEPVMLLAVVALTLLSALFHELGHAAGCHRGGGRAGRIGFGLYLIFPAFYTNVNDAYRLSRRARLRTDLGGVYFSGIAALAAGVGYLAGQSSILLMVALLNQIGLLQQLLPIVRLDGYYILGDLTGVPDMFGRVKPLLLSLLPGRPTNPDVKNMRPSIRAAVTAWVLLTVPILALGTGLLVLQLPTIAATTLTTWQQQWDVAATAWTAGEYVVVALAVITVLLASLPIIGVGLLIVVLTGKVSGIISRRTHKPAASVPVPPANATRVSPPGDSSQDARGAGAVDLPPDARVSTEVAADR